VTLLPHWLKVAKALSADQRNAFVRRPAKGAAFAGEPQR
jgi:hypothetical protein